MLAATSTPIAMGMLVVNMLCWGSWPAVRELCGVPMPAFAFLNMLSQLITSLVFLGTIGSGHTAALLGLGNDDSAMEHLQVLFAKPLVDSTGSLAIMAGGFLLGHGDHLGSLAMQFIPASIAYPLYGGIAVCFGTLLNAAQVGFGTRPEYTLLGMAGIAVGLVCLAVGQDVGTRHAQETKAREVLVRAESEANSNSDSGTYALEIQSTGSSEAMKTDGKLGSSSSSLEASPQLSSRAAMLLCIFAGLTAACSSPLTTFARKAAEDDAYETAFLFALGHACAYPSVAWMGTRIGGVSISRSFKELTPKRCLFGCMCGVMICSGWIMFFLASVPIPPSIALALTACNPLIAIANGFLTGQFSSAPKKQLLLLACSSSCYFIAVMLLASSQ